MCAIVGVLSSSFQHDRTWLARASAKMQHRGPDGSGEWWSDCGRVGLAHRRLAIIDLSPHGHQPMCWSNPGLSIVFNGEIYNFHELRLELESLGHKFNSRTDTEVLLACYLEWARIVRSSKRHVVFVIFDKINQSVFLARDRAGEKPLLLFKWLYFLPQSLRLC